MPQTFTWTSYDRLAPGIGKIWFMRGAKDIKPRATVHQKMPRRWLVTDRYGTRLAVCVSLKRAKHAAEVMLDGTSPQFPNP